MNDRPERSGFDRPTDELLRLKGLLFGSEQQALTSIEELVRKHDSRVGDDGALRTSVAQVLADALREAEVQNHRELAAAIAPVIVAAIKREIRNAGDEVVDALYPVMGRLITAYVAGAIRDFVEQTNRKIENGVSLRFLRLRIKSLLTRTPYPMLLLREGGELRVRSIYLIDRSSGTLLEAWHHDLSSASSAQDEHLISGMLTAINNFAAEFLAEEDGELRALDLGDSRVLLRTSASYLLAMRTTGQPQRSYRKLLDQELRRTVEKLTQSRTAGKTRRREILAELAEQTAALVGRHKPVPVLALSVFAGLFILGGLIALQHYREAQRFAMIERQVRSVLADMPALQGYPLQIQVAKTLTKVTVAGLVPARETGEAITRAISERIHPVRVETRLTAIPSMAEHGELTASIGALSRDVERARAEAEERATVAFDRAAERIDAANAEIASLGRRSAELDMRLAVLQKQADDPLLKLSQWVSTHAIFFADEVVFRDQALMQATLTELRDLMRLSGARIRIIGYTDPSGTQDRNDALATWRAERVAKELEQLGLPRERMKILGRPRGTLLSYDKGPFSSNRRVEFELAYAGEPTEPQGEPLGADGTRPQSNAPR